MGKFCCDLLALLAAEGRVGEDHVDSGRLSWMSARFSASVLVWTMFGRLDAVQDHVHDRDHVGEALLLLAVEGARLQRLQVGGAQVGAGRLR